MSVSTDQPQHLKPVRATDTSWGVHKVTDDCSCPIAMDHTDAELERVNPALHKAMHGIAVTRQQLVDLVRWVYEELTLDRLALTDADALLDEWAAGASIEVQA